MGVVDGLGGHDIAAIDFFASNTISLVVRRQVSRLAHSFPFNDALFSVISESLPAWQCW